jgi:3-mercaptopyruvate sulfurtransferase SseA
MKSIVMLMAALGLILFSTLSSVAVEKPGEVFTVLTSEQLKAMIDSKEPGLVVIDTRSAEEYQEAHIKGAISITWARLENDRSVLNFPKDSKVLFYCNGLS